VLPSEKIGKDMSKVQSAKEENLLLTAYRAVMGSDEKADPAALVVEYERHFSSVVPLSSTQRHNFKRFSMADSNVRVVIKSNTAIV
jgi:hypothetical protein